MNPRHASLFLFAVAALATASVAQDPPPPPKPAESSGAATPQKVDEVAIERRLATARSKAREALAAADQAMSVAFDEELERARTQRLLPTDGMASLRALLQQEKQAFDARRDLPTSEGMRVAAANHRMTVELVRADLVAAYAAGEAEATAGGAGELADSLALRRDGIAHATTDELFRVVAGWSVEGVLAAASPQGKLEERAQELAAKNWAKARPGDPLGWGASIGRFTYGFYTGVSVSKEKEDFSKLDYFLRFRSDLSWESTQDEEAKQGARKGSCYLDVDDVHTWLDLAFAGLPAKAETSATPSAEAEQFFESKKSFVGALGIDWRLVQWSPIENHTLVLAPSGFGSLQTFADAIDEENKNADLRDSVTTRWGAGIRVMGIPGRTEGNTRHPNPLPRHFIGLYFGDDEAVGHHRLMVDSALILDEGTGFFVGFGASMGRGEDDVRVILGFATTLHNVFTALSGLVPEVLK